jgi:hypothetical protein
MRDWKYVDQTKLIEEARARDVSSARLVELAAQGPRVEAEVAKNPTAPLDFLEKLSQSGKAMAWLGLIENPSLPLACYWLLVKRDEHPIDRAIAISKSAPAEIVEKLSLRGRISTLRAIAKNPNSPPNVLEKLSNHRCTGVYRAALKNPTNPLYMEGPPWQRFSRNMDGYGIRLGMPIPMLLLDIFARSSLYRYQLVASRCPNLTGELIELMTQSQNVWVRVTLARHPNITPEATRILAKDPNPAVTSSLATAKKKR